MRISVVIPLYNKAPYVKSALRSVLAQTLPAHEVIVVDDGSTDDGVAVVQALNDARVHLIKQANAGVSAARNAGIAAASGDWIAFLDADDEYQPEFLRAVSELHSSYPKARVCSTGYARVDPEGATSVVTVRAWKQDERGLINDFYREWCNGPFMSSISVAVAADELKQLEPAFPVGERLGEDQDVWFRLAERGPIAYLNSPMATYRIGVHGSATSANAVLQILPCYQRLSDRLSAAQVPLAMRAGAKRLLAAHLLNVARANASHGRMSQAWRLWRDRRSRGHWTYWARSAAWLWWHRNHSGASAN